MSHPTVMRDMQPRTRTNTAGSTRAAKNPHLPDEDDMDFDAARPASRTEKQPVSATNTTTKKPRSDRSNSGTTATTSRAPVGDDPPAAGPSRTTAPSKPQSKMSTFTYREYFPRPIVRYVTNAAEADELVEALNGCV